MDDARVESAINTLLADLKPEVPKLPLHVFLSTYLPRLANREVTDGVGRWLTVSGNVYTPVDIINVDGSVEYQVPPLAVAPPTRLSPDGPSSISANMDAVIRKMRVLPKLGLNYFNDVIPGLIGTTPTLTSYVERWNDILVKNGYTPIVDTGGAADVPHETHEDTVVFDGYDDV